MRIYIIIAIIKRFYYIYAYDIYFYYLFIFSMEISSLIINEYTVKLLHVKWPIIFKWFHVL